MHNETTGSVKAENHTLRTVVLIMILVLVLNAGISATLALAIQNRSDAARQQQKVQSQIVFRKLCTTLESLHADNPPTGSAANNPSRVYLQDLHDRLGELAVDLKC